MDDKKKNKNLLDLEYNTYLTYFEIVIILIGTAFVTLVIGTLPRWNFENLAPTIIILISIMILIWLGFYNKFKNILENIQAL